MLISLDYHLTSTDGSGETITIRNAQVGVPAQYLQWQYDRDYTYYFKIYDNSNYYWGNANPIDLFPITYDAIVIYNHKDGGQTITTIDTTR
jgi:hypothetical protein